MSDAEYVFNQTSFEKKRIARGSFAKKNGSRSKRCSLPSDKLTKKEWKERNGAVLTYNLSRPMDWKTFKKMPALLQREYLENLSKDHKGRSKDIADMFGTSATNLANYVYTHEHLKGALKRTTRTYVAPEWEAFLSKADSGPSKPSVDSAVSEPAEAPPSEQETPAKVKLDTPEVWVERGCLVYAGLPASIFEKAYQILDPNKKYRVLIRYVFEDGKASSYDVLRDEHDIWREEVDVFDMY